MKAEERQHLQDNDLEQLTARARPFFERYGVMLLWGLAAAAVLVALLVLAIRYFTTPETTGWNDLVVAPLYGNAVADRYAALAEDHPDSPAAAWARLLEAERRYAVGQQAIFYDRAAAKDSFADARKAYEAILDRPNVSDDSGDLRVRALFGMAQVLEVASDGSLKPALEKYRQIGDEFPESVYAELATQRVAALAAADETMFYAWFAKQDFHMNADRPRPNDAGGSRGGPAFGPLMPEQPTAPEQPAAPAGAATAPATAPQTPAASPIATDTVPATDAAPTTPAASADTPPAADTAPPADAPPATAPPATAPEEAPAPGGSDSLTPAASAEATADSP